MATKIKDTKIKDTEMTETINEIQSLINQYDKNALSSKNTELLDELNGKYFGYSKDQKFQPLLDAGLVWSYRIIDEVYFISKEHIKANSIFSVLLRFPVVDEKIAYDLEEFNQLDATRVFISKWLEHRNLKDLDTAELKKILSKYMALFLIISVPNCLRSELTTDLEKTCAKWAQLNPEFETVTCPNCGNTVRVNKEEEIIMCPQCGSGFSL